jgi:hypothetical protein
MSGDQPRQRLGERVRRAGAREAAKPLTFVARRAIAPEELHPRARMTLAHRTSPGPHRRCVRSTSDTPQARSAARRTNARSDGGSMFSRSSARLLRLPGWALGSLDVGERMRSADERQLGRVLDGDRACARSRPPSPRWGGAAPVARIPGDPAWPTRGSAFATSPPIRSAGATNETNASVATAARVSRAVASMPRLLSARRTRGYRRAASG